MNTNLFLNDNNDFINGSHERIYNSVMNGAIPVSPGNTYYKKVPFLSEVAIFYERNDLSSLPNTAEEYERIFNNKQNILKSRKTILCEQQSWRERAKAALQIYYLSKL